MHRDEVEKIFDRRKDRILAGLEIESSEKPLAILLGGQPAAGKSSLAEIAKTDHSEKKFLVINGDNYREYHPNHHELIANDTENYSSETQIFSNVFTEGFIQEAIKNRYDVIIEGTMRNKKAYTH